MSTDTQITVPFTKDIETHNRESWLQALDALARHDLSEIRADASIISIKISPKS